MPSELVGLKDTLAIKINTSNKNKLNEFQRFLGKQIISETHDLDEPDSDPITVIQYKASQFERILVDDTSLDIEGERVGVNIKWMLDRLHSFIGKKAKFRCLLGIRNKEKVYIFRGAITGTIVEARGESFGFLPHFQPDGGSKTLAEELPDHFNARYFAVKDMIENRPYKICDVLPFWSGKFQPSDKDNCNEKNKSSILHNIHTPIFPTH